MAGRPFEGIPHVEDLAIPITSEVAGQLGGRCRLVRCQLPARFSPPLDAPQHSLNGGEADAGELNGSLRRILVLVEDE